MTLRGTAASHLSESFSNESVKAALGCALLYTGTSPDRLPAAMLLGLVSMLQDGYFLPQGGMGRIPEVLAESIRVVGGEVFHKAAVKRIIVRKGCACGIELTNGDVFESDAIISTVSAMHTYSTLLSDEDSPKRMRRKVSRSPLSHRGFVLQLGLKNLVDVKSHTNYIAPLLSDQARMFSSGNERDRWLTYTVPTLTCPQLAPHGCGIIEMFPVIDQRLDPDDWSENLKESIAESAINRLRESLDVDIKTRRILSPKEFKYKSHLYSGALYGVAPEKGPGVLYKHRTPVHGLYQAGQTTWPGFGVIGAGMSGIFAAEEMLRFGSN